MDEVILTADERSNYISLCALISGYDASCYEKMNDYMLEKEYRHLNGIKEEN
ncbi:hypothetical protein [Psychrobacillus sp. FSL H8-0510]|uniref:hypothetical protein n=1 Tax=Psychrobacillus sp. FSL H8-0510 TaxID=2921394 RepID=UPI0030F8BF03